MMRGAKTIFDVRAGFLSANLWPVWKPALRYLKGIGAKTVFDVRGGYRDTLPTGYRLHYYTNYIPFIKNFQACMSDFTGDFQQVK